MANFSWISSSLSKVSILEAAVVWKINSNESKRIHLSSEAQRQFLGDRAMSGVSLAVLLYSRWEFPSSLAFQLHTSVNRPSFLAFMAIHNVYDSGSNSGPSKKCCCDFTDPSLLTHGILYHKADWLTMSCIYSSVP